MIDMPADQDHPDEDLEAAFAAIIAGWDDTPSLDDPPGETPTSSDALPPGVTGPARSEWHSELSGEARSEPDPERPDQGTERRADGPPRPSPSGSAGPIGPAASAETGGPASSRAGGPRDWVAADEPDEGYIPPPPPPLPPASRATTLAWAGVLLGPAFLMFCGIAWRTAPRPLLGLAVLAFIGGFVALVLRLPADRDDLDGDDGAVL